MLRLFNTLTKKIEDFSPLDPPHVGLYSCGPTVYDYQHIGHMRRYVGDDILIRILKMNGFDIKHVMNITDVGHLTSDADTGEDKMEKGAKKLGMSVWEIAKKFEQQFFDSCRLLNIHKPNEIMHATDHINDQIELIKILEEKGFTYVIDDGVYFDSSKFKDYGKLSGQKRDELKAGARVDVAPGKKHPTDFALWKSSYPKVQSYSTSEVELVDTSGKKKRQMEWESPWGKGFPGWHIECSAMSMKALGPTFDIHTGGIDHIPIHHTNEIAQSEAASGREFVKYWVHHAFLLVEGEKMSKSLGNIYTVEDVSKKGFDPMTLRYLYLQTHYRQEMNFTWEALKAAQTALHKLQNEIASWEDPRFGCTQLEQEFEDAVNDDLNMPKALSVVWETVNSDNPSHAKAASMKKFDLVLGLSLSQGRLREEVRKQEAAPESVMELVRQRDRLRKEKRFALADQLRHKINKMGYDVLDEAKGKTTVRKI